MLGTYLFDCIWVELERENVMNIISLPIGVWDYHGDIMSRKAFGELAIIQEWVAIILVASFFQWLG